MKKLTYSEQAETIIPKQELNEFNDFLEKHDADISDCPYCGFRKLELVKGKPIEPCEGGDNTGNRYCFRCSTCNAQTGLAVGLINALILWNNRNGNSNECIKENGILMWRAY